MSARDEEAIRKKYGRPPKNAAACLLSRQEKRVMFDSADYAQTLQQKSHHPPAASGPLSQASTKKVPEPSPFVKAQEPKPEPAKSDLAKPELAQPVEAEKPTD